jgi:cytochrome c oxidase subunit II
MLRWLPEDVSPYGAGIDALFHLIYLPTAIVFLAVTAVMIVFLFRYRAREGRRAIYTHGNTTVEILWTIVPAAIFIWLGLLSKSQWEKIRMTMPLSDTMIRVTAKQFNWEILYPGPDGQFGTNDDKQVDNEIHIPVGQPIRVIISSKDVIHSLFLPNLRFKQDAVPGREIQAWFQANKPGKYEVPCAELCGFGHSGMKGWLYALSVEDYRQWQREQWPQEITSLVGTEKGHPDE